MTGSLKIFSKMWLKPHTYIWNYTKMQSERQGGNEDGKTDAISGCTIKIDALYEAINNALKEAKK